MEGSFVGWLLLTSGGYLTWAAFTSHRPLNTALNWIHGQVTGVPGTLEDRNPGIYFQPNAATTGAGTEPPASASASGSGGASGGIPGAPGASAAVAFAQSKIGEGYLFGGSGPTLWDCSGLTQASYAAGGITIPRTATAQYQATKGAQVSFDTPGALLFYGSPAYCYHVGIALGNGQMIDAPHTGAQVRIEPYATAGETGGGPFAATYPPALSYAQTSAGSGSHIV